MENENFILHDKSSDFRVWCQVLWQEHKKEVFNWTGKDVNYSSKKFFSKNKWYLKSLYVSKGNKRWEFQ